MPSRTIYLDDTTDALASELFEVTGTRLSSLFREFLLHWKAASGKFDQLALVQDCSALFLAPEDDPYYLDRWISLSNTERVFLMGTTMCTALTQHKEFWHSLLEAGCRMQVVLQGGLHDPDSQIPQLLSTLKHSSPKDIIDRFERSSQVLKQLRHERSSDSKGELEVRHSGELLLTYSAILIWDATPQKNVTIQIHPYVPTHSVNKGVRFLLTTNEASRIFAAVMRPIVDLWNHSIIQ